MELATAFTFRQTELECLKDLGYEVSQYKSGEDMANSPQAHAAEVLVAYHRALTTEFLDQCSRVRWVQVPHVGVEHLNLEYFSRRGIMVTNARGSLGAGIAEVILLKMLMMARNSPAYLQNQAQRV